LRAEPVRFCGSIIEEKRNEILGNCQTDDERERTAELIRPILRGRDIKRYDYDWAGLYLIATFPSRNYDIELYPAVKNYLLSFGKERLEQTGKEYIVNGEKVKARKKTNNKWFETQDSISYWEDFAQPKIVYQELCRTGCAFAVDHNGYMVSNTAYLLTVNDSSEINIEYLAKFLNSPIALYQLDRICSKFDETGWRWLHQFIEKIYISKLAISDWKTGFQLDDEEYKFICSKYKSVLPELNDTILKLVD